MPPRFWSPSFGQSGIAITPVGVGGGGDSGTDTAPIMLTAGSSNMIAGKTSGQTGIIFDTRDNSVTNERGKGGPISGCANATDLENLFDFAETSSLQLANFDIGDGVGTRKRIRLEWADSGDCVLDEKWKLCQIYCEAGDSFDEVWWQIKWRMGRHVNDSGSSFGSLNTFYTSSEICNTSNNPQTNWGRKYFLIHRSGSPSNRVEILGKGQAGPSFMSHTCDQLSWSNDGGPTMENYVGKVIKWTQHYKRGTGTTGLVKTWLKPFGENETTFFSTTADISNQAFHGSGATAFMDLFEIFAHCQENQVEYWWDFMAQGTLI